MALYSDYVRDDYGADGFGRPIANATVTLFTQDGKTQLQQTHTDAFGYFSFTATDGLYMLLTEYGDAIDRRPIAVGNPPQYKGDPGGNVLSVGAFSAVSGMTIPTGTNLIQTSGLTRGLAHEDTTLTDADVAAYPLAITKTANGRYFRRSLINVNLHMFNPDPTGALDSAPAFNAALAYLKSKAITGGYASGTASLFIPAGIYKINSTINLKQCVRLQGEGVGMAGGMVSKIVSAAGVTPFIVNNYQTLGNGVEATPTGGADGSIIDGLAFVGAGAGSTANADAIWLRARATVSNCYITGFSRNAIRITATGGSGGITEGNANGFTLNRLRIDNCGDDAVYVAGADANAGAGYNLDISGCGGCGVNDSSFLGNAWYSCEVESCGYGSANRAPGSVDYGGNSYAVVMGFETAAKTTVPGTNSAVWIRHNNNGGYPAWSSGKTVLAAAPYLVRDANARSALFGCYSEAGMGPIQGSYRSQAYGCFFEENGVIGGMNWAFNRLGIFNVPAGVEAVDAGYTSTLGGDPNSAQHLLMIGPAGRAWRLKTAGDQIAFNQDNLFTPVFFTGNNPDVLLGGRALKGAVLVSNFGLGRASDGDFNTYGRRLGMIGATSELNGQTVIRGDHFYYHSPVAGGKLGAVCITSGVVGATSGAIAAFKDFGAIDA